MTEARRRGQKNPDGGRPAPPALSGADLMFRAENATQRLVPAVRQWKRLPAPLTAPLTALADAIQRDGPGVGIVGTDDGRVLVVMTAETFLEIARGASL